ncbi:MAG: multicopper oxidase domain-containing protein, partial [Thermomicrobiales bacterium]
MLVNRAKLADRNSHAALSRVLSRRNLLYATAGTGALAAVGAVGLARATDEAATEEIEETTEPRLREFTLTAAEFDHELMPGTTVRAWGYNGQMPGPELRAREGDTVRVTLRNELPVPTTIHWHG